MKLHLPCGLLAAVLACFCAAASLTTGAESISVNFYRNDNGKVSGLTGQLGGVDASTWNDVGGTTGTSNITGSAGNSYALNLTVGAGMWSSKLESLETPEHHFLKDYLDVSNNRETHWSLGMETGFMRSELRLYFSGDTGGQYGAVTVNGVNYLGGATANTQATTPTTPWGTSVMAATSISNVNTMTVNLYTGSVNATNTHNQSARATLAGFQIVNLSDVWNAQIAEGTSSVNIGEVSFIAQGDSTASETQLSAMEAANRDLSFTGLADGGLTVNVNEATQATGIRVSTGTLNLAGGEGNLALGAEGRVGILNAEAAGSVLNVAEGLLTASSDLVISGAGAVNLQGARVETGALTIAGNLGLQDNTVLTVNGSISGHDKIEGTGIILNINQSAGDNMSYGNYSVSTVAGNTQYHGLSLNAVAGPDTTIAAADGANVAITSRSTQGGTITINAIDPTAETTVAISGLSLTGGTTTFSLGENVTVQGGTIAGSTNYHGQSLTLADRVHLSYEDLVLGDSTLTIVDGSSLTTGAFMASNNNAASTINITGGLMNITTGVEAGWKTEGSIRLAHWTQETKLNLSGGEFRALNADVGMGDDGHSVISITGGTMNVKGIRPVDRGGQSKILMSNGRLNIGSAGIHQNGQYAGGPGIIELTGGTLGALDSWTSDQAMTVGNLTIDTTKQVLNSETQTWEADGAADIWLTGAITAQENTKLTLVGKGGVAFYGTGATLHDVENKTVLQLSDTFSISGTLTNTEGGRTTIFGNSFVKNGNGTLEINAVSNAATDVTVNAGTLKVTTAGALGTGGITIGSGATLTYTAGDHTNAINLNGGTVNLNKSGIGKKDADKVAVTLGGDSTIQGNNAALYAAVGGTGKLTLKSDGSEFHVYSDISNEGAVELASGTINIGNGYGGAASIANQGAVDVTGATATLRNGSTITSTGDVNISAGSLAVTNGTTLDNGGDINVSGSGQLKIESGANVGSPINAGTVSLASESATAYKNLLVADGSLASLGEGAAIADATITATGNVSISDLALKGVTLEGSGEGVGFDISGTTTLGGMLTNNSTVTISGTLKADSMNGFDARGDVSYSDGDNGYVNADYTLVKAGEGSSLSIVDSILVNGTATAVKTDAATGDAYASVLGTSGAYHVNKGTVSYAAGAAVASDATTGIVLNGGTLDVTAGTNVTKAMQVNADSTIKGAAGHAGISGGITVSGEGGDLTINSLATTVSDANQHGDYFSLSGNVDLGSHDLVIGKGVVRLGNADTEKPTDAYSFTAGNIVVKDGAALEVYRNGGTINSGVTLENATLRVQQINNSGSENLQFGALTVAGDSTLSRNSWGKSANFSKLTGEGNLRATDPGTTTFGSAEGFTGKLTVEGGNVNFQTGTSFAGTLEAKGGTTTFQGETTLSNAATINGGTMKVDGTLALSGQAIVKAGEVATIGARPTVARSTADGSFTNVTVTADGISSISGKSGSVANADIDVTGDYSIGAVAVSGSTVDVTAGKLAMDGTTLTGTTLTVSANGTLTVGSATLGDGAKLVLNGVGQSAVSVTGTLTFTGTSELDLTNISLVTPTEPLTFLTNTSGLTAEMITTATGTTATVDGNGNVILSGSTPPPAGGEYLITSVVGFNNGILTFSTDMDALSDDVALNYATALWNGTNPVKDAIFKATGSYDAFYSEEGLLVQLTGPDGKTLLDLSAVTSLTINGYAGMNGGATKVDDYTFGRYYGPNIPEPTTTTLSLLALAALAARRRRQG